MIYLVYQTKQVGYDEYDAFVVSADSKEEALKICEDETRDDTWHDGEFNKENTKITELNNKIRKGIVLGSFNAG